MRAGTTSRYSDLPKSKSSVDQSVAIPNYRPQTFRERNAIESKLNEEFPHKERGQGELGLGKKAISVANVIFSNSSVTSTTRSFSLRDDGIV